MKLRNVVIILVISVSAVAISSSVVYSRFEKQMRYRVTKTTEAAYVTDRYIDATVSPFKNVIEVELQNGESRIVEVTPYEYFNISKNTYVILEKILVADRVHYTISD